MRLDKFISNNTDHSRTNIKALIMNKRVHVNGEIIRDPSYKISDSDEITLKGKKIENQSNTIIVIDKPKGYITTTSTSEGLSVMELIPDEYKHLDLKPIGRLDKDTTGILLFTNNDQLIHDMTKKNNKSKKTYIVTLADDIKDTYKEHVENGIELKDGYKTLPGTFKKTSSKQCEVSIYDGKYHQVKRMFAALGNKVVELRRIAFGEYNI